MNPKRATVFLWATFGLGVLAAVPLALRTDREQRSGQPAEPNASAGASATRSPSPPPTPSTDAEPRDVKPSEPPPEGYLACRTANDVRSCREGQKVRVIGKRQLASEGASMIDRALNKGPTEHVTPLLSLRLADGSVATCTFGEIRRADYDEWLTKNPHGSEVVLLGKYNGPLEGTVWIVGDRILPNGFR